MKISFPALSLSAAGGGGRGGGIDGAGEGSGHPGSNQSLPLIGLVACQALTNCVPSRVVMASAAREFPREKTLRVRVFRQNLCCFCQRGDSAGVLQLFGFMSRIHLVKSPQKVFSQREQ